MNGPVAAPEPSVLLSHPDNREPNRFKPDELNWLPAVAPLAIKDLTDVHYEGLTEKSRAQSPYLCLLANDPDVLEAGTRTDKDIFYNADGGLPPAERELAATAVSRVNGCIFCAPSTPASPPVIPAGVRRSTGCCRTARPAISGPAGTPSRRRPSA